MTYYDAEIEYLESDGNQFIDTLFKHNQNTRFLCEFKIITVKRWAHLFGSFGGVQGGGKILCPEIYNSNTMQSYYGPQTSNRWTLNPLTNKYTYDFNKNVHIINNESKTYPTRTFQSDYNTIIFSVTNYSGNISTESCPSKCYYFKIYDNDTLVRDFIPVRIGSVGYMYDKVSDTLFGNAGTGSFILGPDVAGWPGVTGKPKVSSIRRQMIQLMPKKHSVYDGMGTKNLYFHLSGQDAPVNGKWVDRIRNSQWTLTGVTHTDDYYYFNSRKPSSGAADVWASCSNLYSNFDLGEQWAMEIDIEFTSDTTSGQIVDFNSVTGVQAGRCGISAGFYHYTNGKASATMQVKPNGDNTTVTWLTDLTPSLESQEDEWTNAKLTVLCKKINDTQSQLFVYSNGVLNRQSNLFPTIRYNRFDGTAYLGRAVVNGGNYKYQITPFRLKDFKIYTFI